MLISRGTRILYAIECKLSTNPSSSDLSGLKSFHEIYPKVPCFIVAPVKQPLKLAFVRVLSPAKLFNELE